MPGDNEFDFAPEYVAARAVLLDALRALNDHLPAIIVVGAQAVYLHTGSGDSIAPPMTTDGDLALNVAMLDSEPEITAAMKAANFQSGTEPRQLDRPRRGCHRHHGRPIPVRPRQEERACRAA